MAADTRGDGEGKPRLGAVMSAMSEGEVFRLPDRHFEGPNLDLPGPPADLHYEDYEDWRSAALLAVNHIDTTEDDLADALDTQQGVLLAAAAHASAAFPELESRLHDVILRADDVAAVEAAYALVRLGHDDILPVLRAALARPAGAYLSPLFAAGYLARRGDPSGFPVVRAALGSELLAVNMLACKQLWFFVPFQGAVGADGQEIDVLQLFERALGDGEPGVRAQALAQLRWIQSPPFRALLEWYLAR
jgi:hypothetical protein